MGDFSVDIDVYLFDVLSCPLMGCFCATVLITSLQKFWKPTDSSKSFEFLLFPLKYSFLGMEAALLLERKNSYFPSPLARPVAYRECIFYTHLRENVSIRQAHTADVFMVNTVPVEGLSNFSTQTSENVHIYEDSISVVF